MNGVIYLHRRDLRITDNPVLIAAAEAARRYGTWLLVLHLWDPKDDLSHPELSRPRLGYRYREFLHTSLDEVSRRYEERGQRLVRCGGRVTDVVATIQEFHRTTGEIQVFTQRVPGSEEDAVIRCIRRIDGVSVHVPSTSTLIAPAAAGHASDAAPSTFSSFRRRVERRGLTVRPGMDVPTTLPAPPSWIDEAVDRLVERFPEHLFLDASGAVSIPPAVPADDRVRVERGGERAAADRLNDFVWESGALRRYKETRNGLLGAYFSSRVSAALAHGTISPHQVYHAVRAHETVHGANDSTSWLIFELLWRDFFHHLAFAWGGRFFRPDGYGKHARPLGKRGLAEGGADPATLHRWMAGTTDDPLVDAAMKELAVTGYQSNRARQNAASYLIYDLRQPWWVGAAYFEHALTDYDPASNWGNWAYIAGVGADARGGRHFNTVKQAETYDPDGAYRRLWMAA